MIALAFGAGALTALALAVVAVALAGAWRDLGPQNITMPRLTPWPPREAPLLAYEAADMTRWAQARDRYVRASWAVTDARYYPHLARRWEDSTESFRAFCEVPS